MKVQLDVKFREIGRSVVMILFLVWVGMIIGRATVPTQTPKHKEVPANPYCRCGFCCLSGNGLDDLVDRVTCQKPPALVYIDV